MEIAQFFSVCGRMWQLSRYLSTYTQLKNLIAPFCKSPPIAESRSCCLEYLTFIMLKSYRTALGGERGYDGRASRIKSGH
jgi:hypothetical protein